MSEAKAWIRRLKLDPHIEGGHFRRTYTNPHLAAATGASGIRPCSSAIIFLLQSHEKNLLHCLKSDEMWHFYHGSPLTLHLFKPSGEYSALHLGIIQKPGYSPQALIPAGCWFAAAVDKSNSFTLVGCTIAPGFDFEDFQLANRADLLSLFPEQAKIIEQHTNP